jgi:hypothetical protein
VQVSTAQLHVVTQLLGGKQDVKPVPASLVHTAASHWTLHTGLLQFTWQVASPGHSATTPSGHLISHSGLAQTMPHCCGVTLPSKPHNAPTMFGISLRLSTEVASQSGGAIGSPLLSQEQFTGLQVVVQLGVLR